MNYFNESFKEETEMKKSYDKTKMGTDTAYAGGDGNCGMMNAMPGCVQSPIYECPQERVCHRYICHEVPHIMPCNTRIINHHVYRHTYTPCFTSCEENVVSNVYDRKC